MPTKWDAPNQAKLLLLLIHVADVKFSAAQVEQVASLMGGDCTSRAITTQIMRMREKLGPLDASKSNGGTPKTKAKKAKKMTANDNEDGANRKRKRTNVSTKQPTDVEENATLDGLIGGEEDEEWV